MSRLVSMISTSGLFIWRALAPFWFYRAASLWHRVRLALPAIYKPSAGAQR